MNWLCKIGIHKWRHMPVGQSWLNIRFAEKCERCYKERKRGTR